MLFNEENIENLLIKLFLVKQLEKQFLLSTRENNKYKISHRNTVAIIQKTDVALILITARVMIILYAVLDKSGNKNLSNL